jgi:signal transduction histidine kinase
MQLRLTDTLRKYLLPALFGLALLVSLFKPQTDNIHSVASLIQQKVTAAETCFGQLATDKSVLQSITNGYFPSSAIATISKHNLSLFHYRNGTLLNWTDNAALPPASFTLLNEGTYCMKLKNGWYILCKSNMDTTGNILVGLMPIKYQYPIENKFLKNAFAFNVPDNVEITDQKLPGSVPVKNNKGETLFGLYLSGEAVGKDVSYIVLIAQLVALLLAAYYLKLMVHKLLVRNGFAIAIMVLTFTLVVTRALMIAYNIPKELYQLDIFNPKYYASSAFNGSLGDLVINSFLVMWLVFFYVRHYPTSKKSQAGAFNIFLRVVPVFLFTGLVTWVFKTLVMDSVISFEIYNISSLSFYSVVGLFVFSLLLIAHFVFTKHQIEQVLSLGVSFIHFVLAVALCSLAFSFFAVGSQFYESVIAASVWNLWLLVFLWFYLKRQPQLTLQSIIIGIAFYSLITTFLIENLYERKERNHREFFASKLVSERDYVAEYLFTDIAGRISGDAFVHGFFANPLISMNEVTERISLLYLGGYFNKYDVKIYTLDKEKRLLNLTDSIYNEGLRAQFEMAEESKLQYISDSTENYSYISLVAIKEDSLLKGFLALKLTPKTYYGQNVYPELLLSNSLATSANLYNYSYAIYQNDRLVVQSGDFPYTFLWNSKYKFGNESHVFIEEPEWEHGIMRFPNNKKVIVSVPREPVFEPVATFSYLFAFLFVLSVSLLLLWNIIQHKGPITSLFSEFTFSFRTRINYSMLAMIVFSFVIIGIVTISFFRKQYGEFYSDKLLRKGKVVHAVLEYFIEQHLSPDDTCIPSSLQSNLSYEITRLAQINLVDINLFTPQGELLVTSQPSIYDKGIISTRINADAYHRLKNGQDARITTQEKIGSLHYLATYTTLRNKAGQTIAYLGIPYFERVRDVNNEVSGFLVALMNVYVFLLVCAAALAYFISNSVTKPLTIISEKLRILNLNKKNEPIEWKSKDEIGVLISEYNKMITELEKSAQKLARSERESAWREMAKQIAHEIKNPLTPMKLSIQYLQRAIDEGKPNIEQLAMRVAKTLEEQIENLSSIATAFSSFAKMPRPENEIINLNDLLLSICELFSKEKHITVTFTSDVELPLVFADKNQLVSVFNNLIKNAIQSIPEGRAGFVDVNVKEEDGMILVTVSDNGRGIPQENYEKVFVPNFTTKSSGTGLGLAISKRIIDGAGGKIWFESAENVGTAFFVRLNKIVE